MSISINQLAVDCNFGSECNNGECMRNHGPQTLSFRMLNGKPFELRNRVNVQYPLFPHIDCRNADTCVGRYCTFNHPMKHKKNSLGYVNVDKTGESQKLVPAFKSIDDVQGEGNFVLVRSPELIGLFPIEEWQEVKPKKLSSSAKSDAKPANPKAWVNVASASACNDTPASASVVSAPVSAASASVSAAPVSDSVVHAREPVAMLDPNPAIDALLREVSGDKLAEILSALSIKREEYAIALKKLERQHQHKLVEFATTAVYE